MNKGLECLEEIKKEKINSFGRLPLIDKLRIETIEKDLEELERYRKIMTKPILKLISDQIKFEEIQKLAVKYLNSLNYPDEKFMNKVLKVLEE